MKPVWEEKEKNTRQFKEIIIEAGAYEGKIKNSFFFHGVVGNDILNGLVRDQDIGLVEPQIIPQ